MTDEVRDIGLIGLGNMGGALAGTLLRAGFHVIGYDRLEAALARLRAKGGSSATSVSALAASVDVVSIVVVDDEQVEEVFADILEAARPGTPVIVHSTILPETIVELATRAKARGLDLIDATVTGGAEKADLGTLTVMVGGNRAAARRVWPVLAAIGTHVFYVGPSGSGAVMKLVNNLMAMGTYALALEAMSLGRAFGVEEDAITEVLSTGAADSRVLRTWGRTDRARIEQAGSHFIEDPEKDVRSAVVSAARYGVVLPVASTIAGTLPEKFRARDGWIARTRGGITLPRCTICHQELAAPFRSARVHPECLNPPPVRTAPPEE